MVSRFSKVFGGVAINENKPFLDWLKRLSEGMSPRHGAHVRAFAQLEDARLFRSVLNHPQQFPVSDWMTETRNDYPLAHVVLFGPQSRSGKIPEGSWRGPLPEELECDWRMDAPDEVSVTNCLANVSGVVLAAILAERGRLAPFLSPEESARRAIDAVSDVARRVPAGSNVALPKPIVF